MGAPPDGRHAVFSEGSSTATPVGAPALALTKSAILADSNADGLADVGEQIDYSFAVTNTGNAILTDVGVSDPLPGLGPVTCPATTLGLAGSMTCTASYVVTQADVDTGAPILNSAMATGNPPDGQPPAYSTLSSTTTAVAAPALALAKSAVLVDTNANLTADAGEVIDYSFTVTNTGNVPLSGVAVVDAMPGLGPVTCPSTTLGPGASTTCGPVSYVVTEADRRGARVSSGGYILNTATATGVPPLSAPVESTPYSTFTPVGPTPALFLAKSATLADTDSDGGADEGEQIDYSFTVINVGDFELSGVAVIDALPGLSPVTCPSTPLAPSATTTCTASYVATEADVAAGTPIMNSAVATGIPPAGVPGGPVESNTSLWAIPIGSPPTTTTTSTTTHDDVDHLDDRPADDDHVDHLDHDHHRPADDDHVHHLDDLDDRPADDDHVHHLDHRPADDHHVDHDHRPAHDDHLDHLDHRPADDDHLDHRPADDHHLDDRPADDHHLDDRPADHHLDHRPADEHLDHRPADEHLDDRPADHHHHPADDHHVHHVHHVHHLDHRPADDDHVDHCPPDDDHVDHLDDRPADDDHVDHLDHRPADDDHLDHVDHLHHRPADDDHVHHLDDLDDRPADDDHVDHLDHRPADDDHLDNHQHPHPADDHHVPPRRPSRRRPPRRPPEI